MKRYVIIVAGGIGSRIQSPVPKQFIVLNNQPVLFHTITAFYQTYPDINFIVVLHKDYMALWNKLRKQYPLPVEPQITAGGATRFESVKNGLKLVRQKSIVAVHDAVRPFASPELIRRCIETAAKKGTAIPTVIPTDSIRSTTDTRSVYTDRRQYQLVQTPQCFRSDILKVAYRQPYQEHFTDDATVVEEAGFPIHTVEGDYKNIKITTDIDLLFAKMIFESPLKSPHGRIERIKKRF